MKNFQVSNYHHRKQTHKQTGDVIALQVKQTNKAKKYFQSKIYKQMIKQTNKQFNKQIYIYS